MSGDVWEATQHNAPSCMYCRGTEDGSGSKEWSGAPSSRRGAAERGHLAAARVGVESARGDVAWSGVVSRCVGGGIEVRVTTCDDGLRSEDASDRGARGRRRTRSKDRRIRPGLGVRWATGRSMTRRA